ncbi:hypothetical protein [Roseibium sp. RKSG952]|uniref:hypothetical protein n=1 Tax=Roseibium sp. RKSG952 TaxID=2529384 RepID=UPI0012BCDCBC|nr:hypothetical protein [Roseibium sp. RKSG952]MTH96411.1 hypothetical protein [Roseibium sp. RKSG952]
MEDDDDDLCININGVSHTILCGICKEKISLIGEADVETRQAGCAPCGNVSDVQEVARIATEYAKDEAQLMLNRMARDTVRQRKFMTFSGQTEHNETYRFIITDLQF